MLGFSITATGVTLDDESTLRLSREQAWKVAYSSLGVLNTDSATPNGQLITNEASQINNVNQMMLWVINQISPRTCDGFSLDKLCDIIGISRKPAVVTQITVRCFGASGTTIYGKLNSDPSKIQDSAGNLFVATQDYTIANSGYVDALFESVDGFITSVGTFSIYTIQTGWESITTPYPVITGSAEESDTSLRIRYNTSVTQNGVGTAAAMASYIWNNIDDVIYAVGDENPLGTSKTPYSYTINPHSFVISVLGGDNSTIGKAIYDKKSLATMQGNQTVNYYESLNGQTYAIKFLRPSEQTLDIDVTITDSPNVPSDIISQVQELCLSIFNAKPERMYTKYYGTSFQSEIATISGVNQVSVQLSIDGGSTWSDSVQYDIDKYSSFGTVTVNVNEES